MYQKISKIGKGALAVSLIGLVLASVTIASSVVMFARKADAAPTCQTLAITGVNASSYETVNPPTNAIDNKLSTRWSGDGVGSWIRADLGKQQTVCSVDIAWYHGNERTNNFVIAVSKDGTSFTNVYTGKSSGTTTSAERYSFAETTARYVRVTVNGNSINTWASITEIDVIGYTPIVDTTAPSVSITSPASGSTLSTGTRTISGTASDSSGVSTVQVRLDSGSYVTATPKAAGDWSTWSTSLNIASAGSHTIYSKATDKAGNYKESSATITATTADTILPLVAITQPAANAALTSDTISVTGTSSDAGGVKAVEVSVDGGAYATATSTGTGWSTWKATVTAASGPHTIKARATDNSGNQATNSINVSVSISSDTTLDKFGIEKIYATKSGGNEWYVNMADPKSDPMFRNLPSMTKQSDGSWQVSASQVRMEAWSPENEKWLNVEITEYAKILGGSNELLQMYSRGGHHTDSNQCLGSAYKGRLYGDGEAAFVKEITHPAYAGNRGIVQATDTPLADRWVGFKTVIYNFVENGKTYVHMESYIDDDVTDSNGNLGIKNNWKLASVYEDKGGWSSSDSDFNASCFPTNKDSTHQYRQRDEIHNLPGGTSTQNIAAWRSDDLTWDWKYLSVREIQAP
jgi:hypothetical protein